jgi:hypothetical protein
MLSLVLFNDCCEFNVLYTMYCIRWVSRPDSTMATQYLRTSERVFRSA